MIATNYSNIRNNFKKYCDKATRDYETIIVTRKNDENVVLMSEAEYNNLMENLYIMSNKDYYNELLKSKKQAEMQAQDKKVIKKINEIIKDIQRNGNEGIGKAEALKHELSGYWSRRITDKHRFIYKLTENEVIIIACANHYK